MATGFQSNAFQNDGFQIDAGGGVNYALTGANGSYTLTGQAATLKVNRKLSGANGSYVYTGQAATLKVGRKLSGANGSYTLSGQSATFKVNRVLSAANGTYALAGQAATLTYTPGSGSIPYSLSGENGNYLFSGQNAVLSYHSGESATFLVGGGVKPKRKNTRKEIENAVAEAIEKVTEPAKTIVVAEKETKQPVSVKVDHSAQIQVEMLKAQALALNISIEQYLKDIEEDDEEAILMFL